MTEVKSWVVLRVRAQHLARAEENVRNQGGEFYAPHGLVRSDRTRVLARRPLFPGYAFARHPAGLWTYLRGTRGVSEVLMVTGDQPARLADAEVARLRAREGADGLVRTAACEFAVGERVRVERGALSLDAVVDGMSSHDRVFVLMQVLGGARTEVAVRDVYRG